MGRPDHLREGCERGQSNDPFIAPGSKTKAVAEVLAMIANAQAPPPHLPRPVLEADERLFETAAEFCAALEKYAECATQIKRVNH